MPEANNDTSIAVLLPCYNEEATIGKVVRDFKAALPDAAIYVYDNNSTDRTAEIAAAEGAIVRKEPRQGKGNVVRAMFEDIDADVYVMADGDDTYPADAGHRGRDQQPSHARARLPHPGRGIHRRTAIINPTTRILHF